MARLNQARSITGRKRQRMPDVHGQAVAQAYASGLAAAAIKLGWIDRDGKPLINSSRQRAEIRRAMK